MTTQGLFELYVCVLSVTRVCMQWVFVVVCLLLFVRDHGGSGCVVCSDVCGVMVV